MINIYIVSKDKIKIISCPCTYNNNDKKKNLRTISWICLHNINSYYFNTIRFFKNKIKNKTYISYANLTKSLQDSTQKSNKEILANSLRDIEIIQ